MAGQCNANGWLCIKVQPTRLCTLIESARNAAPQENGGVLLAFFNGCLLYLSQFQMYPRNMIVLVNADRLGISGVLKRLECGSVRPNLVVRVRRGVHCSSSLNYADAPSSKSIGMLRGVNPPTHCSRPSLLACSTQALLCRWLHAHRIWREERNKEKEKKKRCKLSLTFAGLFGGGGGGASTPAAHEWSVSSHGIGTQPSIS